MSNLEKIKPESVLDARLEILYQFPRFSGLIHFFSGKRWLNLVTGRFLVEVLRKMEKSGNIKIFLSLNWKMEN
jgi:hypothetical protein